MSERLSLYRQMLAVSHCCHRAPIPKPDLSSETPTTGRPLTTDSIASSCKSSFLFLVSVPPPLTPGQIAPQYPRLPLPMPLHPLAPHGSRRGTSSPVDPRTPPRPAFLSASSFRRRR